MADKFDELKQKIKSAKIRAGVEVPQDDNNSKPDMSFGARAGVEMFAGVAVGLIIGYSLDLVFGTKPWLLIVFLFIGAAAGILNIYKLAIKNNSDK